MKCLHFHDNPGMLVHFSLYLVRGYFCNSRPQNSKTLGTNFKRDSLHLYTHISICDPESCVISF